MEPYLVAVLLAFVALTSAQALVVKASEREGKLAYNTASAVFCAEFAKLSLAYCFDTFQRFSKGSKASSCEAPVISWKSWLAYGVPSLIYAVGNNLNITATHQLGPHVFQLFSNLKLLTAAVASQLILHKPVTSIQWTSLVLLVCAMSTSHIKLIVSSPGMRLNADPIQTRRFSRGLSCVLITATLSGFSGVVNEYLLKHVDTNVSFMRKCIWLYQWGCVLNLLGMFCSIDPGLAFFDGFTGTVWCLVVVNAGMGFSVGYLLKYFDTIVKGFASCLSVFAVTGAAWCLFDAHIDAGFLLALVIFVCATFLYYGEHNELLKSARAAKADERLKSALLKRAE